MSTKPDPKLARLDDALSLAMHTLARVGRQGVQRLSADALDELRAAAQAAHAGGLIRIERSLQALVTHIERGLARDPLFDAQQVMTVINRAWLLGEALGRRRAAGAELGALSDLLGVARRSYVPVEGPVELQVLAASGWVSDSGYVGYTLHAHTPDGLREIVGARPTLHFGDDPRMLWRWPIHDDADVSAEDLAHGAWTLHGARVSADGRLSMHRDLRCTPAAYGGARAYASLACADGHAVVARLRAHTSDPTAPAGDGALIYLEPTAVGPLEVDHTRAQARLPLRDARGATLWVVVPLTRWHDALVDNLQRWTRGTSDKGVRLPAVRGLVARATVVGGQLRLFPHTLVYGTPIRLGGRGGRRWTHVVHLGLERLDGVREARP